MTASKSKLFTVIFTILFILTELKDNVEGMCNLYEKIRQGTAERNQALEHALGVAEKFWDDLNTLTANLKELEDNLAAQEPPALNPNDIREQQDVLGVSLLQCPDIY